MIEGFNIFAKTLLRPLGAGRNRNKPVRCRSHKYRIMGRRLMRFARSKPMELLTIAGIAGLMSVAVLAMKARKLAAEAKEAGVPGELDAAARQRVRSAVEKEG